MAKNKTNPNSSPVEEFINAVDNEQKRKDSWDMIALMKKITGSEPKMWGSSLVGFGSYHYKYESGREGDFFLTGFSPRKTAFTVYIMPGFSEYTDLMEQLGPYKTGKSCLYIKNLDVVDRAILEQIIGKSVEDMRDRYECS
ncbi:DUF1801 domain-containing protein [Pseudomonadota bacterium]